MARRKNTKFIDPRYFMDEKTERLDEALPAVKAQDVYARDVVSYLRDNWKKWTRSEEEYRALYKAFQYAADPRGVVTSSKLGQTLAPIARQLQSDMIIFRGDDILAKFTRGDQDVAEYIKGSRKRTLDDIPDIGVSRTGGPRPDHPFYKKE